jgi:DNA-binding response OmpR family regulator
MNLKLYELKVLYAEDDAIVRENTVDTLSYFFHDITIASHGKEALELLKTIKYDVLITDYVMPYLNGYHLILEARKLYPKLIVFVTSSYTDQDKLLKCIPLGLSDYIIKPLDYHKLSKAIQTIVKFLNEDQTDFVLYAEPFIRYSKSAKSLLIDHESIILSKQEADVIELLLEYRGKVLSKNSLKMNLYGSWEVDDNLLKNLLYRLRKKLPVDVIITIKNTGYMIK